MNSLDYDKNVIMKNLFLHNQFKLLGTLITLKLSQLEQELLRRYQVLCIIKLLFIYKFCIFNDESFLSCFMLIHAFK